MTQTTTTFGALDCWQRFRWRGAWWVKIDWGTARSGARVVAMTEGLRVCGSKTTPTFTRCAMSAEVRQ